MQEPGLDLPAESSSELTHSPEKDIRHRNSPSHGQELTRSGKKDTTVTAHTRSHLAGLMQVGIATAVGAAAALVFQVIAAQHLGPADFGLLATFYAIVTVITYGSASLQNSVAVHAATTAATPTDRRNPQSGARFARSLSTTPTDRRNTTAFRRRIPTAALTTGALGAVVLASMTPFLAPTLNVTPVVILATAIYLPLSFVFADTVGLIQGTGRSATAVWLTTISIVAGILFVIIAFALGTRLTGAIIAVIAGAVIALVGAAVVARRIPRPTIGVFSRSGITVIVLTLAFSWLTNADVIMVRTGVETTLGGSYASAAVITKAAFLLPAALSLYFLPRLVRVKDNPRLVFLGVGSILGMSVVFGMLLTAMFALLGNWLITSLFGSAFHAGGDLLALMSLSNIPWLAAQGLLIWMTSLSSWQAAAALMVCAPVQLGWYLVALPNINLTLLGNAVIGTAVLLIFMVIGWQYWRTSNTIPPPQKKPGNPSKRTRLDTLREHCQR